MMLRKTCRTPMRLVAPTKVHPGRHGTVLLFGLRKWPGWALGQSRAMSLLTKTAQALVSYAAFAIVAPVSAAGSRQRGRYRFRPDPPPRGAAVRCAGLACGVSVAGTVGSRTGFASVSRSISPLTCAPGKTVRTVTKTRERK
jgi:hypothetical protein